MAISWTRIFFTVGFFMLFLEACDTVGPEDRLILMPTLDVSDRTVLLEEFTGQFCSNCPAAHAIAAQLVTQYGGKLVAVSIHGGSFGLNEEDTDFDSNFIGLATKEGNAYHRAMGIKAWPAGIVNRISGAITSDAWAATVRKAIQSPSKIGIIAESSIEDDNLTVNVTLIPGAAVMNPLLHVWVVENNIHSIQQNGSEFLTDYEHNHVFRKALTPMPDGMEADALKIGEHSHAYRFETPVIHNASCRWNPENLGVVVFVETSDEGVLQTVYQTVAPAATEKPE